MVAGRDGVEARTREVVKGPVLDKDVARYSARLASAGFAAVVAGRAVAGGDTARARQRCVASRRVATQGLSARPACAGFRATDRAVMSPTYGRPGRQEAAGADDDARGR